MAFVDEDIVAARLNKDAAGTNLTFRAVEAEDESVDAEVLVLSGGVQLESHQFQVGGGYISLNHYGYTDPTTRSGFYTDVVEMWGVQEEDLAQLFPALQQVLAEEPAL